MPEERGSNFFTELLKFAIVALIIVVPVRLYVAQPFIVSGASMVPTFESGQYLIVDELSYHFVPPARGEVIVFRYPKDQTQFFIKRIIGLPGETVKIEDGAIYVGVPPVGETSSFERLDESYVKNIGNGADKVVELKADQYFVMGDNRPESSDSRSWGVLPKQNIIGRAFVRLLPFQSISLFPGSATSH